MKWLALMVCLAGVPPIAGWIRQNPRNYPRIWVVVGILPFLLADLHLYMALDSWSDWGGYVKGAEVSVLDILILAIYLSLPATQNPLPFKLSMSLYFLAVVFSAIHAEVPTAALFYPFQLARMFLVYAVVTRAVFADQRVAPNLLTGMAVGLILQAIVALWQRFGMDVLQTAGTLGAQNLLGLLSHLIVFPFFALLLAGAGGWLAVVAVLSGIVVEVFTTSRATVGLAGCSFAMVFVLSAFRRWTSRKMLIGICGMATLAILVPVVMASFQQRERINNQASSDFERTAYEKSALMMLSDYPLGVGANHFTLIANTKGYYLRAGVPPDWYSLAGRVHNVYYLIAAETGYPGVATFLFMLACPLFVAFSCARQYRRDLRGDLQLGLGVGLLAVYIHSFFEWSLVIFQSQYMVALCFGSVAGIAQQLGYWQKSQSRDLSRTQKINRNRAISARPIPSTVSLKNLTQKSSSAD